MNALCILAVVFLAGAYGLNLPNGRERRDDDLDDGDDDDDDDDDDVDVDKLIKKYGLKTNPWGKFKSAEIWRSPNSVDNNPVAVAWLLLYNNGVCGPFNTFENDRLYVWNRGGRAEIDIFGDDGKLTQKCLGDPLDDINCNYEVHIPAGTIANLRPKDDYIVHTGIIFMGTFETDGKGADYDAVLKKYPQHKQVIEKTKKCYN